MLLASLKFRGFSVASLSAIADTPGVINGVVGVSAVPIEHAVAGGPAITGFPGVDCVLSVANGLSDYGYRTVIFSAIKLSDIGSRPQSTGLSDIGLKKISVAYLCS